MPGQPDILIYTRMLCGYCASARQLLKRKGLVFEEIDTTMDNERRREMIDRSGRRTVPQIFIGERHVGGYDDLAALEDNGQLDQILSEQSDSP